jgi:hypothetical protein
VSPTAAQSVIVHEEQGEFDTPDGQVPGVFLKTSPYNNSTDVSINPTLSWGISSKATSYEYCIDTGNDNVCTNPATWINVGNVTSVGLSGLSSLTTYYWQVRAKNSSGVTLASGGWWRFTTLLISSKAALLPFILRSSPPPNPLNGDFELGRNAGWQENSSHGWVLIMDQSTLPKLPHSGSWAAWLGGGDNETAAISQLIAVKTGGTHLRFWYWTDSGGACGSDFGYVRINGNIVHTWSLCTVYNTFTWVELNLDLSAYVGLNVTLEISVVTDGTDTSSLFIDDVSFAAALAHPADTQAAP